MGRNKIIRKNMFDEISQEMITVLLPENEDQNEYKVIVSNNKCFAAAVSEKKCFTFIIGKANGTVYFKRVSPKNKTRYIAAFEENGEVVRVVRDSVNNWEQLKSFEPDFDVSSSITF